MKLIVTDVSATLVNDKKGGLTIVKGRKTMHLTDIAGEEFIRLLHNLYYPDPESNFVYAAAEPVRKASKQEIMDTHWLEFVVWAYTRHPVYPAAWHVEPGGLSDARSPSAPDEYYVTIDDHNFWRWYMEHKMPSSTPDEWGRDNARGSNEQVE